MRVFFWCGAFWVLADGVWIGASRGREWGAELEMARKRSAGTDAGVMGRDAWVWSGRCPCCDADVFIRSDSFAWLYSPILDGVHSLVRCWVSSCFGLLLRDWNNLSGAVLWSEGLGGATVVES